MFKTDFCLRDVIKLTSTFLDKRYYPELAKVKPDK